MTRDEYTDLKEYIGFRRKYQSFPTGPACERERELDKKFEGLDIMAMVLGAYEKAQHELDAVQDCAFQYRSDKEDMQRRLKLTEETAQELADALEGILTNVSLDWYVQQVGRVDGPKESGAVSMIHNEGVLNRIRQSFAVAQKVLTAWNRFR